MIIWTIDDVISIGLFGFCIALIIGTFILCKIRAFIDNIKFDIKHREEMRKLAEQRGEK